MRCLTNAWETLSDNATINCIKLAWISSRPMRRHMSNALIIPWHAFVEYSRVLWTNFVSISHIKSEQENQTNKMHFYVKKKLKNMWKKWRTQMRTVRLLWQYDQQMMSRTYLFESYDSIVSRKSSNVQNIYYYKYIIVIKCFYIFLFIPNIFVYLHIEINDYLICKIKKKRYLYCFFFIEDKCLWVDIIKNNISWSQEK